MPAWHGKFENVDLFAFFDVIKKRTGGNRLSRDRRNLLHLLTPSLDEIHVAHAGLHPEGERQAPDGGNQIGRDAIALRVIFDAVKKQRRPILRSLVDDFCERRQLKIPIDPSTVINCPSLSTSLSQGRRSGIGVFLQIKSSKHSTAALRSSRSIPRIESGVRSTT